MRIAEACNSLSLIREGEFEQKIGDFFQKRLLGRGEGLGREQEGGGRKPTTLPSRVSIKGSFLSWPIP